MTVHRMSLVEAFARVADGTITDSKSIAGITLAAQRLGLIGVIGADPLGITG